MIVPNLVFSYQFLKLSLSCWQYVPGILTGLDFLGSQKNFPFPGKNSQMGEFWEIPYNPLLQNSVATVRKSTDSTQRTLPDSFVHNSGLCLVIDVTSR